MKGKNKQRLDRYLAEQGLVKSRHQAADLIRTRQVKLGGKICDKPSLMLNTDQRIRIRLLHAPYVGRGGFKLQGAAQSLEIEFKDKIVLDVGACSGGFSDYALRFKAKEVVAVDVGKELLDKSLLASGRVRYFPKTDIRDFVWPDKLSLPDIILVDVSFISLLKVIDSLRSHCKQQTLVLALAKPQFETSPGELHKGLVKNRRQRKEILLELEKALLVANWQILAWSEAHLKGLKGNLERFYLLKPQTTKSF